MSGHRGIVALAGVVCMCAAMAAGAAETAEKPLLMRCYEANREAQDELLSPRFLYSTKELKGVRYWIVQFSDRVSARTVETLADNGLEVIDYVPEGAYLVKASKTQADACARIAGLSRIVPFQPAFKVNPELLTGGRGERFTPILLWCFPDEPVKPVRRILDTYGVRMSTHAEYDGMRFLLLAPSIVLDDLLVELCRLAEVRWVDYAPNWELCNDYTYWLMQSGPDAGFATPIFDQGIHGEGQIVGLADTGVDIDMCYFWDSTQGLPDETVNLLQRKVIAYHSLIDPNDYDGDPGTHGTHVCGILTGDDFLNPPGTHDTGDGMAPAAQV
ncbi:S8 family serine peptidase, partial [bacterium]|nr:S8 family serine peptidase [candidate division CSSED10-310 bacterium]